MANIEAEITHITIDSTGYGHTDVSASHVEGEDYVLAKIDELEIKIDTSIALALCMELAKEFKFGLVDEEVCGG